MEPKGLDLIAEDASLGVVNCEIGAESVAVAQVGVIPETVIAPAHLAELRSAADILPKLIETFRRESSLSFDLTRKSIAAGDGQIVARCSHCVLGAAGSLGGTALAASCRELEQMGRTGRLEGAEDRLEQAVSEYELLCGALDSLMCEVRPAEN